MSVIDPALRFSQCAAMLTHDQILRELRGQIAEKKFTQKALADRLGIAPPRVKEMLDGVRRIQPAELPVVADWLGLTDDNERQPVAPVPLLGDVPAGNWRQAIKNARHSIPSPDPSIPSNAYALRVKGDSMDLHVPDGAMIIVDPTDLDLWPGRFYVVENGDGETTFKQYRESPARLVPCSSNPAHKEIPIGSSDFRVVGRVIWQASRM